MATALLFDPIPRLCIWKSDVTLASFLECLQGLMMLSPPSEGETDVCTEAGLFSSVHYLQARSLGKFMDSSFRVEVRLSSMPHC